MSSLETGECNRKACRRSNSGMFRSLMAYFDIVAANRKTAEDRASRRSLQVDPTLLSPTTGEIYSDSSSSYHRFLFNLNQFLYKFLRLCIYSLYMTTSQVHQNSTNTENTNVTQPQANSSTNKTKHSFFLKGKIT